MTKYYYQKSQKKNVRSILRIISLAIFCIGFFLALYVAFPLISWQLYFAPVFASNDLTVPIPKTTIVNPFALQSLISEAANTISGIDYSNAENWFPTYKSQTNRKAARVSSYTISIPKLKIKNAVVSTTDNDLSLHLVNYTGTAVPPDNGNAVIFGHSTLPQLFSPIDYTKIFATVHMLQTRDEVIVHLGGVSYSYKIFSITVVNPEDTSVFAQNFDNSYLTLVTCTPPGTTWKRLTIRARLEKL